ncbi:hypothetical protein PpBr36_09051 [Pyricularia pennisetigena]|uniref:hypothetical protein n=1 Tax=Pyricularia pennisetigena TaxID=1578925 RepID=UPI001153D39A|nr:hypothetical protein PpBr36_09051 [Pyricularia pennisetigena]TLS24818.1 hypothetical protein PpBr36_09051 [Pyricularia pennisetigena]
MNAVNFDTPDIRAAYDAVRSNKDDTNWLLLTPSGKEAELTTGKEGWDEFVSNLDDAKDQYGYARVEYANDSESTRTKFVLVIWNGKKVEGNIGKRRFGIINQKNAVMRLMNHYSLDIQTEDKGELKKDDVVKELRRTGGADYNGGRG